MKIKVIEMTYEDARKVYPQAISIISYGKECLVFLKKSIDKC